MVEIEAEVFLEVPSLPPRLRTLCRGVVAGGTKHQPLLRFAEPGIELAAGAHIRTYRTVAHRFSLQLARIVSATRSEAHDAMGPLTELVVEWLGAPAPTEQRACYRVSAYQSGLTADVDALRGCEVLDVSATGLSVLAPAMLPAGEFVDLVLHFEHESFRGAGSVQSVLAARGGKFRCGLHVAGARGCALAAALTRVNAALQRRQLARLAGRA